MSFGAVLQTQIIFKCNVMLFNGIHLMINDRAPWNDTVFLCVSSTYILFLSW